MKASDATTKPDQPALHPSETEDYGKSVKFDESDQAGCLSLLGILVFIPLLVIAVESSAKELRSVLAFIQWTSLSGFLESVRDWLHTGSGQHGSFVPVILFVFGLPLLIWQWVAFALGRHTLIRPARLWLGSSAYFAVTMLLIFGLYAGAEIPLLQRVFLIMAWWIIPGTFLCMTIRMWARTPINGLPRGRVIESDARRQTSLRDGEVF